MHATSAESVGPCRCAHLLSHSIPRPRRSADRRCAPPRQDTVFDDPFPLFDFLVPALTLRPDASEAKSPAQEWLCLVAQYSSPREVIMAVEQHQATPRPTRLNLDSDAETGTLHALAARHAALVEVVTIGELSHRL